MTMVSVNDPVYRAGLEKFAELMSDLKVDAGDPSYPEIAFACEVSTSSTFRYFNGEILPPWRFMAAFLHAYGEEIAHEMGPAFRAKVKADWTAVRQLRRQAAAVPEDQDGPVDLDSVRRKLNPSAKL